MLQKVSVAHRINIPELCLEKIVRLTRLVLFLYFLYIHTHASVHFFYFYIYIMQSLPRQSSKLVTRHT